MSTFWQATCSSVYTQARQADLRLVSPLVRAVVLSVSNSPEAPSGSGGYLFQYPRRAYPFTMDMIQNIMRRSTHSDRLEYAHLLAV